MRRLAVIGMIAMILLAGCGPLEQVASHLLLEQAPAAPAEPRPTDSDVTATTFCGINAFAWTERSVVARSAQPPSTAFACLKQAGFGAVVNLRGEDPGFDEAAVVKAAGMSYLLQPIPDDTAPSPEQVSEYLAFVDEHRRAGLAVLTHDAAGRGRMGFMDGVWLLWRGWETADVFERYIRFGAKVGCEDGGKGQIQAMHEIGQMLGGGSAWPGGQDRYGTTWSGCPRPDYMSNWDYQTVRFPSEGVDRS